MNDFDLALPGKLRQSTNQFGHDLVFPGKQFSRVNLRLAKNDTVFGHLFCFVNYACRVQQRLRRNTADVEANTAQHGPAFDKNDIHPKIGGAKGGRVTTRAGAKDHKLGRVSHALRGGIFRCDRFGYVLRRHYLGRGRLVVAKPCLRVRHYGIARNSASTSPRALPKYVVKRTAYAPSMTR